MIPHHHLDFYNLSKHTFTPLDGANILSQNNKNRPSSYSPLQKKPEFLFGFLKFNVHAFTGNFPFNYGLTCVFFTFEFQIDQGLPAMELLKLEKSQMCWAVAQGRKRALYFSCSVS